MASQKSIITRVNILILALCLYLLCESFASAIETKKETVKPKKAILLEKDKKADVKNSKLGKASLALVDADSPPTLEEEDIDDLWNNRTVWEDFKNNTETILNGSKVNRTIFEDEPEKIQNEKLDSKVASWKEDQRYFYSEIIKDPVKAMGHWVDLDSLPKHQTFTHEVLSDSHRRAASINLPFKFPFYGQNVTRATIATGGFLYMGEHVHSWLAATQYVAPLMANFDTRNSTESSVLYGYNATLFVIEWRNVKLQEQPNATFTFQCILYVNGDIAFVYKNVPILIKDIPDSGHPVKIGVSDAYFINRAHVYVRRKTIYEYHKLDMINTTAEAISNQTAIFLTAKATCTSLLSCTECMNQKIGFDCVWCPLANRCSDGYDRQRQDWVTKKCDQLHVNHTSECPAVTTPAPVSTTESHSTASPAPSLHSTTVQSAIISTESADNKNIDLHDKNLTQLEYNTHDRRISNNIPSKKSSGGSSVWLSLFFMLSIVAGFGLWVFYAYRNPTSSSGQLLIRWRPSVWRWNSAETRYTAASIHM